MRFVRIFCGIITGRDIRRMRELEAVMRYWHNEETTAMARAQESMACRNIERAKMWSKRCNEARMRCETDYRKPMAQLMGTRGTLHGAREYQDAKDLLKESKEMRDLLRRIARKGEFMDREGLRLVVEDWLARRHLS